MIIYTDVEIYEITQAMSKFGGGFIQSLSECIKHADSGNKMILMNAFPGYFEQYKEIYDKHLKDIK